MKAIITVGCSASGKSTWAKQYMAENKGVLAIERDKIRRKILDLDSKENLWNHWNFKNENAVTEMYNEYIEFVAHRGFDIICADTNLNEKYRNQLIEKLKSFGYEIEIKSFHVDYKILLERDKQRVDSVGQQVIAKQYEQWIKTEWYPFQPVKADGVLPVLPYAVIVDVDGTIAHNGSGRSPFDWNRVDEDTPKEDVIQIVACIIEQGILPVFVSGRSDVCFDKTYQWIKNAFSDYVSENFEFDLIMRAAGDNRSDDIVKYEIYRDRIAPLYDVKAVFDDRPKVARMFRSIGLQVMQVGNPHIEF